MKCSSFEVLNVLYRFKSADSVCGEFSLRCACALKNGSNPQFVILYEADCCSPNKEDIQVMANEDMQKIDLTKDGVKLSTSDLHWMKQMEQENIYRVNKLRKLRRTNFTIGGLLALTVVGIYTYTINAVKQESYFEDFEYPETEVSEE